MSLVVVELNKYMAVVVIYAPPVGGSGLYNSKNEHKQELMDEIDNR